MTKNKILTLAGISAVLSYLTSLVFVSFSNLALLVFMGAFNFSLQEIFQLIGNIFIASIMMFLEYKTGFFLLFPAWFVVLIVLGWIWELILKIKRFFSGYWIGF